MPTTGIVKSYGPTADLLPFPNGQSGGKLISGLNAVVTETRGLGENPWQDWPDVRMIGSPEEFIEADHSHVQCVFKVPYAKRGKFVSQLLGYPLQTAAGYMRHLPEFYRNWQFQITDSPTGSNVLRTPNRNVPIPQSLLTPVMYCTKASVTGTGIDDDWQTQNPLKVNEFYYPDPKFKWAFVTAMFETLAFDAFLLSEITPTPAKPYEMQRYVIKNKDSDGRYLQYQLGQFVLLDGSGHEIPLGRSNLNFWEAFETIKYEWLDVLPGMTNQVRNQSLCGLGNSVAFDDYPPGTVFLRKATEIPRRDQFGRRIYNYLFEILHIPTGINNALKPGSRSNTPADYLQVVEKGNHSRTPYTLTDLTVIFTP